MCIQFFLILLECFVYKGSSIIWFGSSPLDIWDIFPVMPKPLILPLPSVIPKEQVTAKLRISNPQASYNFTHPIPKPILLKYILLDNFKDMYKMKHLHSFWYTWQFCGCKYMGENCLQKTLNLKGNWNILMIDAFKLKVKIIWLDILGIIWSNC